MAKQEICVDGQIDFINGALPNPKFEQKLAYVANRIRNAERPVAFTKDKHYKNYLEHIKMKQQKQQNIP